MNAENQLIEAITGKPDFAATSREDWLQLLDRYPAFGTGHLLYARKLAAAADPDAALQQQASAVHFSDLRWLDLLLKQGPADSDYPHESIENQDEKDKKAAVDLPAAPAADIDVPIIAEASFLTSVPGEAALSAGEIAAVAASQTDPQDIPETSPDTLQPTGSQRIASLISAQLADFKKPLAEGARLDMDKDPLYKTDYFASQGILIPRTEDELGKKVKKFTDWLKDMKQNGQATPQLQTTPQEEELIILKAAASLKTEAVWTESMAEVLLQQGKRSQAREVYQKLSLLYPEKTSYFATKIDSLL